MSVDTNGQNSGHDLNEEITNAVIVLPPSTKMFEAGGHKYFVEPTLALGRYKTFQRMEIELGFTVNFSGLVENLTGAYHAINERRDADCAVTIKETLDGCRLFNEDRAHISAYVATLFINRADEDRSVWSKSLADEKLEHWKNIDANFFLSVGLAQVNQFPKRYKELNELMTRIGEVKSKIQPSVGDFETANTGIGD